MYRLAATLTANVGSSFYGRSVQLHPMHHSSHPHKNQEFCGLSALMHFHAARRSFRRMFRVLCRANNTAAPHFHAARRTFRRMFRVICRANNTAAPPLPRQTPECFVHGVSSGSSVFFCTPISYVSTDFSMILPLIIGVYTY
jgi:hypothetical protein